MKTWCVKFYICCIAGCGTSLSAQNEVPASSEWTNNALSISVGRFWSLPPKTNQLSGPPRELRIVGLTQWNFGVTYERFTKKKWSYGAMVDLTEPFFSVEAEVDDPAHGTPPGSFTSRIPQHTRFIPGYYFSEWMLFAGWPVIESRRWRLDAALEAGVNPRWSTWLLFGIQYAPQSDTGQVGVYIGALTGGPDIYPMFGFRLNATYRLGGHDRLMLALEGRMSATTFWGGGYNMYGLSSQPSEGEFKGNLAYIGFRMGYAFTWGPPRKPKWMRQQEAVP